MDLYIHPILCDFAPEHIIVAGCVCFERDFIMSSATEVLPNDMLKHSADQFNFNEKKTILKDLMGILFVHYFSIFKRLLQFLFIF